MIWRKLVAFFIIYVCACIDTSAQMPVEQERHHKVVFENQWIRVLDMIVPAEDTTSLHTHSAASVVLFLSKSNVAIQNAGRLPIITLVNPGDVVYRNYDEQPVSHIVWSEDKSAFRCMVAELKQSLVGDNCTILSFDDVKLLWQQKLLNAYHLNLFDNKVCRMAKSPCPLLLLTYSGTHTVITQGKERKLTPGEFVFIPTLSETEVQGDRNAKSILIQIKH